MSNVDFICNEVASITCVETCKEYLRALPKTPLTSNELTSILCSIKTKTWPDYFLDRFVDRLTEPMAALDIARIFRSLSNDPDRIDVCSTLLRDRKVPLSLEETRLILSAINLDTFRVDMLRRLLRHGVNEEDKASILDVFSLYCFKENAANSLDIKLEKQAHCQTRPAISINDVLVDWPKYLYYVNVIDNEPYVRDDCDHENPFKDISLEKFLVKEAKSLSVFPDYLMLILRVNGVDIKWPDQLKSINIKKNEVYVDGELYYDTESYERCFYTNRT